MLVAGFIYAQNIEKGAAVQVLTPETVNLPAGDAAWLPGQIQDKVKSNVQDYLELKTVVDSKAEAAVKKLQAEAEGSARDENTAIELGKLTTAKYALFTKIRKTASGYVVSADFTDLTTGVQKASATSKEYAQASSLYGSTGAVDEITLALAGKLGIKISDLNKNLLSTGSSSFSVDEQLELARQNEEQFRKMMADYDADLARLSASNDLSAVESKKKIEAEKALLEEKQNAGKKRQEDLRAQKERADADAKLEAEQAIKILEANWASVEMKDGNPTEAAMQRRANKVLANNDALLAKFFADCESVKQSTMAQQNALLQSIDADYKKLAAVKTVSSMGGELKVSYGTYDGDKCGWNAYLSLYSDGILLFQDTFIVKYETLAGKAAPDMEKASDTQLDEYISNTDMYTSLLVRGDPILYFELDYNAIAAAKSRPSTYTFYFTKLRAINTVSGKVAQTSTLNAELVREMKPAQDLREIQGVVEAEQAKDKIIKDLRSQGKKLEYAEEQVGEKFFVKSYCCAKDSKKRSGIEFAIIPGREFIMSKTEITQAVYKEVMGKNPSKFKNDDDLPVENVSWYDAVEFCNRLSKKAGLEPFYSVNGTHVESNFDNEDGFRLPSTLEWWYASKGGQEYKYSGSNNLDEVGWYKENSGGRIHPVAQKKPNGYGLYDMSGNVAEWTNDGTVNYYYSRSEVHEFYGGDMNSNSEGCRSGTSSLLTLNADSSSDRLGFRIVRSTGKK